MPRGMTKQKQIELEQRRVKVAKNVLAGMSYRDMANSFSVSLGTISNDVKTVMKRYREDQIAEYADIVQIELRRLDAALSAIWDGVLLGKKESIELMINLQNQRAKYLSLFAPDTSRLELLFPDLANPEEKISLDEIRRKRWEQIFPQLEPITEQTVIDAEARNVTSTSNLPDTNEPTDTASDQPTGTVSADSA